MITHASREDAIPGVVRFKKPTPGQFPHYELPSDQLSHGPSLGNRKIWVNTRSTGHIERIFCNAVGLNLFGSIIVTYAAPTKMLISSSPEPGCLDTADSAYVLLDPEGPGNVSIFPFWQTSSFDLAGELHVEETILVPKVSGSDPPAVLQNISIKNRSTKDAVVLVTIHVDMQGSLGNDLIVNFNDSLGVLEISNDSHPDLVRLIGAPGCGVTYRTTHDVSAGYAVRYAKKIPNEPLASHGPAGEIQFEIDIEAGGTADKTIVAAVSHGGIGDAREWYKSSLDFAANMRATVDFLTPANGRSMVETPDPIINQGVFWSKVNMLKVMADYPEGPAFTNEPGKSTNVVGRDVAWFVYGCDSLDPAFSEHLLLKFAQKQYENGKIPEYYCAMDGHVEDYDLSMNDDTPLFVLACCRHYGYTRDEKFLNNIYPNVLIAAKYIASQMDERNLVIVNAEGYEVKGIASWRNVIPDYQINGAITEINSECYAALKGTVDLCKEMDNNEDAESLDSAAEKLHNGINTHLLNPDNGLYYLNIDSSGNAHTDVTADEVFPVMFELAQSSVANRIINRLRDDDFMTVAGLRTVSSNSPDYEPTKLVGLKGGVWPGVAFWYASAAAKFYPEFMVDSLHASYLQYLVDPLKNNTVPGQFSEWFDGNSLVNRGMRLSPWEPPRLLWAAVHGLCGVSARNGTCTVSPPRAQWKWLALRRMPYADKYLTFFAVIEGESIHIYTNMPVSSPYVLHISGKDVSNKALLNDYRVHRAAFQDDQTLTVCLGSENNTYTTVNVKLVDLLKQDDRYDVRIYSRNSDWVEVGMRRGEDLTDMSVGIEDGDFRIIKITIAE